jgi:hypothetical protein
LICEKDQSTGNIILAQRLSDPIGGIKVSAPRFSLFRFPTAKDRICEEHKVSASEKRKAYEANYYLK